MKLLRRGKVLLWIIAIMLVGATGGFLLAQQARRFSETFAKVEADKSTLMKGRQELITQVGSLEGQSSQLKQAFEAVTTDRDVLLAKIKKLMQEKEDLFTVTDLHERVLKHTAEENRALKGQLEPLQHEHDALKEEHRSLVRVHEQLQQQLEESQAKTGEKRLKSDLANQQERHEQDAAALEQSKARVKELEARQAALEEELPQLHVKLTELQDKYTWILSENKTIRFKSKNVPADVTRLAREHERLLKDLGDTHYNMGVLFVKGEDYPRAVKEFEKVVELRPDDADAFYNLGLIFAEHLPDRKKAMTYFHKYLDANPHAQDASFVKQYIASWKAWEAKESLE